MAQPSGKFLEGVFAVSKPPSVSSAQVLRDLQHKFSESKTFAPLLQQTLAAQNEQDRLQPKRRRRTSSDQIFKMGHGGTLDPLATGVLIAGIGRGTKSLSDFLFCKKTYETVVLFGKNTDTYDIMGKVVAEAPTHHITRDLVEGELIKFQGKMKQIPPIYSAIKIEGMKLYDYARSGKELPRQLESREIEISECTLLDFYASGEHEFKWPAEQATEEEKALAQKLIAGAESTKKSFGEDNEYPRPSAPAKEKKMNFRELNEVPRDRKAALHTHDIPTLEKLPADAPAARIRLTVSSGFYVRSFAYDLGTACGSYGTMASLVRSEQAQFTTIDPAPEGSTLALTYEDLESEDFWGPKMATVLEEWMETHPPPSTENRIDDRDLPRGEYQHKRSAYGGGRQWVGRKRYTNDRQDPRYSRETKRRNSSSPEI